MNRTLRKLCALALLVASFVLAALVIRYQPLVEHVIRSVGVAAMPIATAIFALIVSAPFTITDALAVMNGAIFGPFWGSVINAVGLILGSILGYQINLHAAQWLDVETALERLPAWIRRLPAGSPAFLLAVRVIPGLGGTIATAVAATFRVPVWVHVWTMCLVAVPICTLLAIFGNGVTVVVHGYESRARIYMEHHRPHLHWRFRHRGSQVVPVTRVR